MSKKCSRLNSDNLKVERWLNSEFVEALWPSDLRYCPRRFTQREGNTLLVITSVNLMKRTYATSIMGGGLTR